MKSVKINNLDISVKKNSEKEQFPTIKEEDSKIEMEEYLGDSDKSVKSLPPHVQGPKIELIRPKRNRF